jgi:hypothetical protein
VIARGLADFSHGDPTYENQLVRKPHTTNVHCKYMCIVHCTIHASVANQDLNPDQGILFNLDPEYGADLDPGFFLKMDTLRIAYRCSLTASASTIHHPGQRLDLHS